MTAAHLARSATCIVLGAGLLGCGATGASGGASQDAGSKGDPRCGFAGCPEEAGSGAQRRWASQPVADPPTYPGSVDNSVGCARQYRTTGFEPVDASAGRHPLFLYFVGTTFIADDQSSRHDSQAALKVTEAMARRGFVALSVQYDNGPAAWLGDHANQLACLFGAAHAASLVAVACGLPRVDCNRGIATWGHSQGALVADMAANLDARVRVAWTTGYGGDARSTLPKNRLRVVNAEGDTTNATVASLNLTAGFTPADCPDDGRTECLRSDGSGWILVRRVDCQVTSGDHCWFDKPSCLVNQETLEPSWIDPESEKPFALEANADWVAETVRRL